jgi:hypothetical protein
MQYIHENQIFKKQNKKKIVWERRNIIDGIDLVIRELARLHSDPTVL